MKGTLHAKKEFVRGSVDKRIFGSFIEQLGRAVYGGVYEIGHPTSDEEGFRGDVMDLVRELDVPLVRFPGGNYVSNFNWEDSVGPKEKRPTRLDLAWKALDPNQFGIQEFMHWAKKVDTDVMMVLNLGTRGLSEARDLVEYCNHPGSSYYSELRKKHGSEDPYAIKLWALGNEMDGPWQVGHKTADEYGRLASEVAKALKLFDPELELIACGSSHAFMPTFPQWEQTVLEHTYDEVDYLSLHLYLRNDEDDIYSFLAASQAMDSFIDTVVSVCDYVKAKKRSKKTMYLCFDEWNVWFHSNKKDMEQEPWIVGPGLLEDVYTFEDALVVGCMLNSLLRHADRVKIACLAQLVNTIAPIMTETGGPAWRQTIFWPYYYASKYGRGEVLDLVCDIPGYEHERYGHIKYADTLLVHHQQTGELDLFVVNRHQTDALDLDLDLCGFEGNLTLVEHILLEHENLKAVNDKDNPDEVVPEQGSLEFNEQRQIKVPKCSWNLYRFQV